MSASATADRQILVEVRDLAKHYGAIRAVDGISFQVRRGDVLGFLGPNGAGKTTAMKMITGFLEPDRGRVRVAGHDVAVEGLAARRRLGYLPEAAPAYGEMTVRGFLGFIAAARGVEEGAGALARVAAMTGLEAELDQPIETLSKGYKRRVGLAQALIHDPEVLILDEPTDGLDPNQKAVVQELISGLSRDRAIVLSTHILDEAERVCNRALIISRGRILVDSTPAELMTRARNHNVLRITVDPGAVERLSERLARQPWCLRLERWSESTVDVYPRGGENHLQDLLAAAGGIELHDVRLQEGRFDEFFREITAGVTA